MRTEHSTHRQRSSEQGLRSAITRLLGRLRNGDAEASGAGMRPAAEVYADGVADLDRSSSGWDNGSRVQTAAIQIHFGLSSADAKVIYGAGIVDDANRLLGDEKWRALNNISR